RLPLAEAKSKTAQPASRSPQQTRRAWIALPTLPTLSVTTADFFLERFEVYREQLDLCPRGRFKKVRVRHPGQAGGLARGQPALATKGKRRRQTQGCGGLASSALQLCQNIIRNIYRDACHGEPRMLGASLGCSSRLPLSIVTAL